MSDLTETAEGDEPVEIPLEYTGGPRPVRFALDALRPSLAMSAFRAYIDDSTIGGAACAALLWRQLGKAAGGIDQPARQLGMRAIDKLVEQGWTIAQVNGLCSLAAYHVGRHVGALNVQETQDF